MINNISKSLKINKIPLIKPYFDNKEIEMVDKTLQSGWVAQGPMCNEFEKRIKNYLHTTYAITTSNCTASLYMALKSLWVERGDEVIVSDFSYPATGIAVTHCGATPRFADVCEDTYNINPESIKKLINDKTRAIIAVHAFGNPCRMEEIEHIAKINEIPLIEDAACALGSKYNNKSVGIFGDVGCFSLHARKGITTGEGGITVTKHKVLYSFMRRYVSFGVEQTFGRKAIPIFDHDGFNFKMSDINAAIGISQLEKIDGIICRKREIAHLYQDLLDDIDEFTPQLETPRGFHNYQSFVSTVTNVNRDSLIHFLERESIESTLGTYAQHVQPIFNTNDTPTTSKKLFDTTIAIPIYYSMTDESVHLVSDAIHKFFRGNG